MADPRPDDEYELTFVVKIRSYGKGDLHHRTIIGTELARHIKHGFGGERAQIYHEGSHLRFDALAFDGEHDGHDDVIRFDPPFLVDQFGYLVTSSSASFSKEPAFTPETNGHVSGPPAESEYRREDPV